MSGALILAGYAALVWSAGWWGAMAAVAHVATMLAATRGKR